MTKNELTIAAALRAAEERLAAHACPDTDARREAEALLCHAARIRKETALAHPDRALAHAAAARLDALVARRLAHEPLAYLLGNAPFLGRVFDVSPASLIPRPATEVLVTAALAAARARGAETVLVDVGTGSGCIAVTLAAELPKHEIIATDASEEALEVAIHNAKKNDLTDRVTFVLTDLLEGLDDRLAGRDLLIVANLPYIPSSQMDALAPELHQEPASALDGGPDGLDPYRALFAQLDALKNPSVTLFAEMLPEQTLVFSGLAVEHGFTDVSDIQNDAGIAVGVVCSHR
jgi:release factor glutamine methyltransferase